MKHCNSVLSTSASKIELDNLEALNESLIGFSLMDISNDEKGNLRLIGFKQGIVKDVSFVGWNTSEDGGVGHHWFSGEISKIEIIKRGELFGLISITITDGKEDVKVEQCIRVRKLTSTSLFTFVPFEIDITNYREALEYNNLCDSSTQINNYNQIKEHLSSGICLVGSGVSISSHKGTYRVLDAISRLDRSRIHIVIE